MNQKRIKRLSLLFVYLFLFGILFFPLVKVSAEEEPNPSSSPSPVPTETTKPSPTGDPSPEPSGNPSPTPSEQPPEKSSNAFLSSLSVTGHKFTSSFKKNTLKYTVNVPTNVSEIYINAEAEDSKASVSGYGKQRITSGTSTFKIVVIAEDGTEKVYQITAVQVASNLNLKSLKVTGQTLNETFDPDKTDYTMTVPYEIEELKVQAAADDATASVSISGTSGLRVGTNTVTVTVKSTAGEKKIYNIVVTREEKVEDEGGDDSKTSVITSHATSSGTTTPVANDHGSDLTKYILVTIGCLVLFAIGGIGIYFYIKTGKKKEKKKSKLKSSVETESAVVIAPAKDDHPAIYDYEEGNKGYEKDHYVDDLDDTIEFDRGRIVSKKETPKKRYQEDVLKDIEDLFEDDE